MRKVHYGTTTALCGMKVKVGMRLTMIASEVTCQECREKLGKKAGSR